MAHWLLNTLIHSRWRCTTHLICVKAYKYTYHIAYAHGSNACESEKLFVFHFVWQSYIYFNKSLRCFAYSAKFPFFSSFHMTFIVLLYTRIYITYLSCRSDEHSAILIIWLDCAADGWQCELHRQVTYIHVSSVSRDMNMLFFSERFDIRMCAFCLFSSLIVVTAHSAVMNCWMTRDIRETKKRTNSKWFSFTLQSAEEQ